MIALGFGFEFFVLLTDIFLTFTWLVIVITCVYAWVFCSGFSDCSLAFLNSKLATCFC